MRVTHTLHDLANDMASVTKRSASEPTAVVSKTIRRGAGLTRAFARKSAGKHGKLYPLAIGSEMLTATTGEWGSDSSMDQGGMSFEYGSRNQRPHLDHAKARDIVVPELHRAVDEMIDGWFW